MSQFRNINIEWLQCMHEAGYITLCDGDLQEVLDVIFE
ncbi:Uncharacterised protein [Yersinia enterocolitica]|nr:Uncharacterised protein [Yersinia enterocolitica]CQR20631.1 Uncharacterised protein [Yersinia enterocolitica]CRX53840.1 Uncharacterised protein [Yersinia enterocolitica]